MLHLLQFWDTLFVLEYNIWITECNKVNIVLLSTNQVVDIVLAVNYIFYIFVTY